MSTTWKAIASFLTALVFSTVVNGCGGSSGGGGGAPPPSGTPDLVTSRPPLSKSTLSPGEQASSEITITNSGTGDAGAFRVGVYVSTNSTVSKQDTLVGSFTEAGLSAGNSVRVTATFVAGSTSGNFFLGAIVDDMDQVVESNESNNASGATAFTVAGSGSGAAPQITSPASSTLPDGTVGTPNPSVTFTASGSTPITWGISSGSLPPGMTLTSSGVYSGTPTSAGTFSFQVAATNSVGDSKNTYTHRIQ